MRLAIVGAGAVGRSVAQLAGEHGHDVIGLADSTGAALGDPLDVPAALERKSETGAVGDADHDDLLGAAYDVLVEATPTTLGDAEPGFSNAVAALDRDRHVVLANKGPVAERYDEIRAATRESAGELRFEATVGGAIPAVRTVEDFGPSRVERVRGVLNGTANFVLSRMAAEGLSYDHVLAEAQELGVAEADPTFDVDGTDAALKGVIVANVLREARGEDALSLSDAEVAGIEDLPVSALSLAGDDGRTVRLIAEASPEGVRVGPRLVPENGTLAVTGTQNIVQVETAHAGRLNLSGHGAGGPETASAVLSDVGRLPPR
ncbi:MULTISPECIES: homoserine dehydrogenase [Halolamina]|uniref:homoserine dehydrogenase n=1 Tax=Halolamina pelagica TaxID=699431 RepID=A0A1I5RSG1_9EURY|nr:MULTISPECIES: homoserine dehydrogenase [Halolamina]NHX35322.1 homoserine dehydrogenase [Halolamina sp. R1-12]SFP61452.1 homoserine dehydrogenase [Halolamina pelagica]